MVSFEDPRYYSNLYRAGCALTLPHQKPWCYYTARGLQPRNEGVPAGHNTIIGLISNKDYKMIIIHHNILYYIIHHKYIDNFFSFYFSEGGGPNAQSEQAPDEYKG